MDGGCRPHALIVDDDALICRMLGDMLHWLGLEAEASTDSRDALARLDGDEVCDLLVADLILPDLSGWDLVQAARVRRPDLKVLLITGLPSGAAIDRARQAGLVLLPKPFTMAALGAAVGDAPRGGEHVPEKYRRRQGSPVSRAMLAWPEVPDIPTEIPLAV